MRGTLRGEDRESEAGQGEKGNEAKRELQQVCQAQTYNAAFTKKTSRDGVANLEGDTMAKK